MARAPRPDGGKPARINIANVTRIHNPDGSRSRRSSYVVCLLQRNDNEGNDVLHLLWDRNFSENILNAIKLLIEFGIDVESNGIDDRILLQRKVYDFNLNGQKHTLLRLFLSK